MVFLTSGKLKNMFFDDFERYEKIDFVDFFDGKCFFSGKNSWGQEMDSIFKEDYPRYQKRFNEKAGQVKLMGRVPASQTIF